MWRTSLKNDFDYWDKSSIEKAQLQFCKIYLGVNKKASDIACRAEMGQFPAKIDIDTNILKYWMHIDTLEDNTLVKQAFFMSKNLSERGHKSFHSYIKGLLQKMKMCSSNDSDIFSPQNFSLNNILSTLNDNYINRQNHSETSKSQWIAPQQIRDCTTCEKFYISHKK